MSINKNVFKFFFNLCIYDKKKNLCIYPIHKYLLLHHCGLVKHTKS